MAGTVVIGKMNNQESGRLGGLVTFLRYGSEGMAERGSRGGRPRVPSLERQQQSLEAQIKEREVMDTPSRLSNNRLELRKLYLHRRSSGSNHKQIGVSGELITSDPGG